MAEEKLGKLVEWHPDWKTESSLINDTSGGSSNRGFGQNTKIQTIQIGKGENIFQVDASGVSNVLMQAGKNLQFTSVTAPIACVATLVATDTGNLSDGNYKYKITYVNASGETELGAVSNTVTVDATHKQVALSDILTSGSGSVIARKIYRTKVNGLDYYLLTTMDNNSATTYTDNVADASLGADIANFRDNTTFGKIIINNGVRVNLGVSNTFLGTVTGTSNTFGYQNTGAGVAVLQYNTVGYQNSGFGFVVLQSNISGYGNSAFGANALAAATSSSNCVAMGINALLGLSTEDGSIGIGAYAGAHDTAGNSFFVNNIDRVNSAGDRSLSLIWGQMADTAADQRLTINALLRLTVSKTPAAANAAGTKGDICWDTSYIYVAVDTNSWKRVAIAAW